MSEPKKTIKDSVFTFLFSQPEYMKQLYLVLHPEDTEVREDDFKLVTLENVLSIGQYNDLGFQVRDTLILLIEAQSTFSYNIPLRMLMYLGNTYKEYVEENKLSIYKKTGVSIPRPELYVVYTGAEKNIPKVLRLSDLYEGQGSVDVEVKVLQADGAGDILDQYIQFCEIQVEQVKLYGKTDEALSNILRICLERGILAPFLNSRMKEVADIMTTLFDQEKVWEIERYNIAQENRNAGRQEGLQEGRKEGLQEARRDMLRKMLKKASILEVSQLMDMTEDEIRSIVEQ